MFASHQKTIQTYAQSGPEALAHVITFVYATVQQSINTVPAIMEDIDENGAHSEYLWGWKREAYMFVDENQQTIFDNAMALYDGHADPIVCERELIAYFATLPGLGLVKGGFVVQLAFGLGGCIDRHNVAMLGADVNLLRADLFKNGSHKARAKRLDKYQALLASAGGTEMLWDNWCEYVADKFPNIYESGFAVSRLHVEALRLV
jgi:hypothetical protein